MSPGLNESWPKNRAIVCFKFWYVVAEIVSEPIVPLTSNLKFDEGSFPIPTLSPKVSCNTKLPDEAPPLVLELIALYVIPVVQ